MRRELCLVVLALSGETAVADDGAPKAFTSIATEPVPGVDELLTRTTLTTATAAISTKDKDTQFRVTVVPSQFVDAKYNWPFSEFRLVLLTDTSNSLTRLTVSTGYNPYSRRSRRVEDILAALDHSAKCGDAEDDVLNKAKDKRDAAYAQAELDHKTAVATADATYTKALEAAGRQVDLKLQAVTVRLEQYSAADDQQATAKAKADATYKKAVEDTTAVKKCVRGREAVEWRKINSWSIPSITLSAAYDVFPYGHKPNASDMTMEDALLWHGGPSGQVSFEERPSERIDITAWVSAKYVRTVGDPGTPRAHYYGGGSTVEVIAVSLLPGDQTKLPDFYLKDGFVPGIGTGGSVQLVDCTDGMSCNKGRTFQFSLTPFVDVLLSPSLQFRVAVPITAYEAVDKNGSEVATTFSIAGTIGSP